MPRRQPRVEACRTARRLFDRRRLARRARGAGRGARARHRHRRIAASTTATARGIAMLVDLLRQPRAASAPVSLSRTAARIPGAARPVRSGGDARAASSRTLRGSVDRGDRRAAAIAGRDIRDAGRVRRRNRRRAVVCGATSGARALEGRLVHLRAGRRRRAADRRADLVPARHDPRLPVGGADAPVRRRDLRRRSGRAVDAARARAADDGDPARRPLRRRVRRRDRHDEGQPGGRRADDDGPRSGALPGRHRGSSPRC